MTLRELITTVRNRLDDTRPPYLWSDAELTQMLNDRQNELCEKCGLIRDSFTTAVCNIAVISGTATYTLDTRIVHIMSVKLGSTYTFLEERTRDWLDETYSGWESDTGTPRYYILDDSGKIRLYPNPTANSTLYLNVTRYPITQLTLTTDTASPEIPWKYHKYLVDGVCAYAYSKDDAETLDMNRVKMYEQLWQRDLDEIHRSEINFFYQGLTAAPLYGNI